MGHECHQSTRFSETELFGTLEEDEDSEGEEEDDDLSNMGEYMVTTHKDDVLQEGVEPTTYLTIQNLSTPFQHQTRIFDKITTPHC
jgi:hypothetical protein